MHYQLDNMREKRLGFGELIKRRLIDGRAKNTQLPLVRLWLSLLAYNLWNLWRRLALPTQVATWSLTSLQQRLVKTGGRWSSMLVTTPTVCQLDAGLSARLKIGA